MSIEAMKHYEAALMAAFPHGAVGKVFEHWNKARQAIEHPEKQEPVAWLYIEPDNLHLNVHYDDVDRSQFPHDEWFPVYKQPKREWVGLMRGVRVEDDTVVITVKGGNEAARQLCAELLKEKNT